MNEACVSFNGTTEFRYVWLNNVVPPLCGDMLHWRLRPKLPYLFAAIDCHAQILEYRTGQVDPALMAV